MYRMRGGWGCGVGEAKEKVVVRWTEEECREEARGGWINGRVLIDVGVGRTNGRGAGVSPSCDRYIKLILNRQLKLHSLFISRAEALGR